MKLRLGDQRHLEAAEGWMELGNMDEANAELDEIHPIYRSHPLVLHVRWGIYAKAEKWETAKIFAQALSEALPTNSRGWIQWAYSLHELKRTEEAKNVLLPVVDKFPSDHIIRYDLACYCCQSGDIQGAWKWLERAIDLSGRRAIRVAALDDPNLEPLWNQIAEI